MSQELTRNKLQEKAMQILYSYLLLKSSGQNPNIVSLIEDEMNDSIDECDFYLKYVLVKAVKYEDELISYISSFLKNWTFNRLNFTIQAILLLSLASFKFEETIDKKVTINVAIKLAKKYGDEKDYRFINAILDNALNDNLRK